MKLEIIWEDYDPLPLAKRAVDEATFADDAMAFTFGQEQVISSESVNGPHVCRRIFQTPTLETAIRVNDVVVKDLVDSPHDPIGLFKLISSCFVADGGPEDILIPDLNMLLKSRNDGLASVAMFEARIRRTRNVIGGVIDLLKKSRKIFPDKGVRDSRGRLTSLIEDGGILSDSYRGEED